jgi:hypothetical protein
MKMSDAAFISLGIALMFSLVPITYHTFRRDTTEQCAQRWAGSGYEARTSGGACVVKINGKEFPEQNIRVETSAFDVAVDYE